MEIKELWGFERFVGNVPIKQKIGPASQQDLSINLKQPTKEIDNT
jgi:hypothetical protein